MAKLRLTDRAVKGAKTVKERDELWDAALPGLVLRVYATGRKYYDVVYRASGRRARFKIGDANLLSLADARAKAREILVRVEKGENPAQRKRELRAAETFDELADRYLALHCEANLRPRSIADIKYQLKSVLRPAWGKRKAREITRADIIALIEDIGVKRKAPVRANHVRAVISGIFNFAIQRGIIDVSPCVGLPRKYREIPRERTLSDKEIVALWTATESEAEVTRDLIRTMLLLGQRSNEVRQMRHSQISKGIWTIPPDVSKNAQEHAVPLPEQVLTIIAGRERGSDLVFPSYTGEAIKWMSHANARLREKMKTEDPWRIHDLRRTCATGLERLGYADNVIAAVLNHMKSSRLGVTGRYVRHDFLKEKGEALQAWADHVHKLVEGGKRETANVIPFRRRRG